MRPKAFSSPFLTSVINSNDPRGLISAELWRLWTDTLRSSNQIFYIHEIASKIGINTPIQKAKTVSDYLEYGIEELISIDTPVEDMGHIVFKCVAYAAIELDFKGYTLEDIVHQAIKTLKAREQRILKYRYGLFGNKKHTLQDIGDIFGLTRERIRQIENKAKQKLKHPSRINKIKEAVLRNDRSIWNSLSNSSGIVYKSIPQKHLYNRLVGEFELAIKCCFKSIKEWLSKRSDEKTSAWYRSGFPESSIEECLIKLDNCGYPLPTTLSSLCSFMKTNSKLFELAVGLSENMTIFNRYVVKEPLSQRVRRCVNLHRLFWGYGNNRCIDREDLTAEHNIVFAKEACSVRDAEIVMMSNPHLFLRIGDIGWCPIGASDSQVGVYDTH